MSLETDFIKKWLETYHTNRTDAVGAWETIKTARKKFGIKALIRKGRNAPECFVLLEVLAERRKGIGRGRVRPKKPASRRKTRVQRPR